MSKTKDNLYQQQQEENERLDKEYQEKVSDVIDDTVRQFDPSSQNNSKEIVRNDLNRLKKMNEQGKDMGVIIAQSKYGVDLDYSDSDAGEAPTNLQ